MPAGDAGTSLIYVSAPSSAVGGYLWSFYGGTANTSDLTTIMGAGAESALRMFFTAAYAP
jgi:hypothetical protein